MQLQQRVPQCHKLELTVPTLAKNSITTTVVVENGQKVKKERKRATSEFFFFNYLTENLKLNSVPFLNQLEGFKFSTAICRK